MARPTVGVEAQTVRAVGMIEGRKAEMRAELGNGESTEEMSTALAIIRGLDEAESIILRAIVAGQGE